MFGNCHIWLHCIGTDLIRLPTLGTETTNSSAILLLQAQDSQHLLVIKFRRTFEYIAQMATFQEAPNSLPPLELIVYYTKHIFLLAPSLCFLTYVISRLSWEIEIRRQNSQTSNLPPTIPNAIPFLGHIPSLLFNPKRFIHNSTLV